MTDKTVDQWEAEDHIKDVQRTIGTVMDHPQHDCVARGVVFAIRHIDEMRREFKKLPDAIVQRLEAQALTHADSDMQKAAQLAAEATVAKLWDEQPMKASRWKYAAVMGASGLPPWLVFGIFVYGKAKGWW